MQDKTLTAADKVEVQELIGAYYLAEDGCDVEPWVACFARDGGFKTRAGQSYFGHEQLRGFAEKRALRPDSKLYVHWMTNVVVTATAEGARARYYSMTIGQSDGGLRIRGMALNTDELVREDGRWCFRLRDSATIPVAAG